MASANADPDISCRGRDISEGALYTVEERLETFKVSHWPFDSGPCTPLKMCEAGFYYCGTTVSPDWVRCVVCHHDMEGWEPNDDPLSEHKTHAPGCAYLKIVKDPYKVTIGDLLDLEKAALDNYVQIECQKLTQDLQDGAQQTRDQLKSVKVNKPNS